MFTFRLPVTLNGWIEHGPTIARAVLPVESEGDPVRCIPYVKRGDGNAGRRRVDDSDQDTTSRIGQTARPSGLPEWTGTKFKEVWLFDLRVGCCQG